MRTNRRRNVNKLTCNRLIGRRQIQNTRMNGRVTFAGDDERPCGDWQAGDREGMTPSRDHAAVADASG